MDYSKRFPINPLPVRECSKSPISRPARRIGVLIARQQLDGVDGLVNNLFKGQYDDEFGVVDPATNVHSDKHIFQDALLRNGYESKMNQTSE